MNGRRVTQLVALLMIGDGVSGLLKPHWHSLLWEVGPPPFRPAMEKLADNPDTARLFYAIEIVVGTWLAARLTPEKPDLI